MIGGNDVGFVSGLTSCMFNVALMKVDNTCDLATPAGRMDKAQEIYGHMSPGGAQQGYYETLKGVYEAVRMKSPATKLYVLGYPKFLYEKSIACPDVITLTQTERTSINQLIDYFNATIRSAAHDAGATYIDIGDVLANEAACGTSTAVTELDNLLVYWLYTQLMQNKQYSADMISAGVPADLAIRLSLLKSYYEGAARFVASPNTAVFDLIQQIMHPNAYGHELIYGQLEKGLGSELLASDNCNAIVICPGGSDFGAPDVSRYIPGLALVNNRIIRNGEGAVSIGHKVDTAATVIGGEVVKAAPKTTIVKIASDRLKDLLGAFPIGAITVELHSDPVQLGTMTMQSDGTYSLSDATIPSSVRAGWHTVHLLGRVASGSNFDVYAPVFVRGPLGDYDDDGVADELDTCAFGTPSGHDADGDGVDDACDVSVSPAVDNPTSPLVPPEDTNLVSGNRHGVASRGTSFTSTLDLLSTSYGGHSVDGKMDTRALPTTYRDHLIVLKFVLLILFVAGIMIIFFYRKEVRESFRHHTQ